MLLTVVRRYTNETMLEIIPHLPAAARRGAQLIGLRTQSVQP